MGADAPDAGRSDARERPAPAVPQATETWDAGALSCGELLLQLRRKILPLPPGAILHVVARDPGAPLDLRAWSRVTGHTLVCYAPPEYWIQRKEEDP